MYNDDTIEYSTIYQQKAFRTLWKNSSSTYFLNYRIAGKFGGQKIWRIACNRREN